MDEDVQHIYRAGLKFLVSLSAEEMYITIVDEFMKLVQADYGSILIERDRRLHRVYASHLAFYKIIPRPHGFMYKVFQTGKPLILSSQRIEPIHPEIKELGIKSDIIVPLSYQFTSIGVLTAMSKKAHHFSHRDLETLMTYVPMATLAIRKTQLYEENRKALEMRDLFISMAAHELRTPLTTINAYAQLVQKKLQKSKTFNVKWIDKLVYEVKRLTDLVNELLQVDQIKKGTFSYKMAKCNIEELIEHVLINFRMNNSDHTIIFQNRLRDKRYKYVYGDFNKLLQVMTNILNNSVKFAPKKSKITLYLKRYNSHVVMGIKDRGIGISKKDLPHIFNRFYRGTEAGHQGMGLGLYVAKHIIEDHHGTIQVSSQKNRGTRVEITLPRSKN